MRLIDILNKIANGELKEGSKIISSILDDEYTYNEWHELVNKNGENIFNVYNLYALKDAVELIEPQEPTDNTKIEELEAMGETKFEYGEPVPADWVMANKINEIIRYINK